MADPSQLLGVWSFNIIPKCIYHVSNISYVWAAHRGKNSSSDPPDTISLCPEAGSLFVCGRQPPSTSRALHWAGCPPWPPFTGQCLVPGKNTSLSLLFCFLGLSVDSEIGIWGLAGPSVASYFSVETHQALEVKGTCLPIGETRCLCICSGGGSCWDCHFGPGLLLQGRIV